MASAIKQSSFSSSSSSLSLSQHGNSTTRQCARPPPRRQGAPYAPRYSCRCLQSCWCWCLLPSAHSACARARGIALAQQVRRTWRLRRRQLSIGNAAPLPPSTAAAATNSALLALLTLCVEVNGAWCLLACFNASDYCWHWCSNQTIVLVIF